MMKPIEEAKAKERQRCGQGGILLPQNSDEQRTDETVAAMAAVSLANMVVGGDRVSEHSANLQNVSQSDAAD